ncbi:MAG TPA: hypothetical protein VHB46_10750 [Burkholderiales bacterium]|nr:hypothetical protein [Burkholderiales bacterium]
MHLTEQERHSIASRAAALERRTGTQLVAAVAGKSDSYPEAPWKAFALGAAAAAALSVLFQLEAGDWNGGYAGIAHVLVILSGGVIAALGTVLLSPVARLFTDATRREIEVRQHAQALFYRHRLDRTRGRVGVLLFVSRFERRVELIADAGFDGRVDASAWAQVTDRTAFVLRHAGTAAAMRAGMDALEALLLQSGIAGDPSGNELPDEVLDLEVAG